MPESLNAYPDPAAENNVECLKVSQCTSAGDCNTTFISGCGTTSGCSSTCSATEAGQILVQPGANSSTSVLPWIDSVEDFCNSGSGQPRNPELRAGGATPLAGSVRTALAKWYQPIYETS